MWRKECEQIGTVVLLEAEIENTLTSEAKNAAPFECCGALLGQIEYSKGAFFVAAALPLENNTSETATDRFLIDSQSIHKSHCLAKKLGIDLIGFYHSHPKSFAIPSETDKKLATAWPGYLHIIISVLSISRPVLQAYCSDRNNWTLLKLERAYYGNNQSSNSFATVCQGGHIS